MRAPDRDFPHSPWTTSTPRPRPPRRRSGPRTLPAELTDDVKSVHDAGCTPRAEVAATRSERHPGASEVHDTETVTLSEDTLIGHGHHVADRRRRGAGRRLGHRTRRAVRGGGPRRERTITAEVDEDGRSTSTRRAWLVNFVFLPRGFGRSSRRASRSEGRSATTCPTRSPASSRNRSSPTAGTSARADRLGARSGAWAGDPEAEDVACCAPRVHVTHAVSRVQRGDRDGAFALLDAADGLARRGPSDPSVARHGAASRAPRSGREVERTRVALEAGRDDGRSPPARGASSINLGLTYQFLGRYHDSDLRLR